MGETATQLKTPERVESSALLGAPSTARRYYCLVVLMLVSAMSILDRHIMNILVEPIRRDLGLSDSQMGVLTGVAFAFVYATLCIPAARLADRWSRRKLIALAITGWSLATMACGAAGNAVHMFLARFGVGAGEACGNPASQALISDMFPRKERGTAMAVLMLSSPLGMSAGLAFGGWALEMYGWRVAFLLAGVPGLLLGPLIFFSFPEVRKGLADGLETAPRPEPFLKTLRTLWRTRSFPNMAFAAALAALLSTGLSSWIPAFFVRSHGLDNAMIGVKLGAALGAGSLIGHIAGGPLSDWLGRRDLRWHLWLPAITTPIAAAVAAGAFIAPPDLAFTLLGVQLMLAGLFSAPLIAITMNLAPIAARATAGATLYFVLNAVGLGLGPQIVGVLSDLLKPTLGAESLRIALLSVTTLGAAASFFFVRASLSYRRDIAAIDARNQASVPAGA